MLITSTISEIEQNHIAKNKQGYLVSDHCFSSLSVLVLLGLKPTL
jgi:hypothetical protein